ncbi:MAG: carbamoyltransferase [Ectothiorhodospiraceae bacterium]|nr:carbamoyltransferase [Ectothiorhodospiraceae bacterium]
MSVVLGLNAYHADASACLVVDGRVAVAVEEERLRRVKHWAGFPTRAIACCLDEVGMRLDAVDHVAINASPRSALTRRLAFALGGGLSASRLMDRARRVRRRLGIADALHQAFPDTRLRATVHTVDHHLAHLATAWAEVREPALAVSVDGFGDFASAAWGPVAPGSLVVSGRIHFPHSLGLFYQAMTQLLGFPDHGDEYKVMGLAAHGRPTMTHALERVLGATASGEYRLTTEFFTHARGGFTDRWDGGEPRVGRLYSPRAEALLGPARGAEAPIEPRHLDLAASVQAAYERALFTFLRGLHRRHPHARLVLGGGCAMNSVANGRITAETPFRELHVHSAPGDAGGALGAALWVAARHGGLAERPMAGGAALGPRFDAVQTGRAVTEARAELDAAGCVVERIPDAEVLVAAVARHLAGGEAAAWFQGAMEWGPRALGHRSILADPRRADMREHLNRLVKRREEFRPFAPAVLAERAAEWFELDGAAPYMERVCPVRATHRARIPAVVHVDGTARPQTVLAAREPLFHALIVAFERATGVPLVLNTSFNRNEPIVCTPADAIGCFLRTTLPLLALGPYLVTRPAR